MRLLWTVIITSAVAFPISFGKAADDVTERAVPGSAAVGGKSAAGSMGGIAGGAGTSASGGAAGAASGSGAAGAAAGGAAAGAGAFPGAAGAAAGGAPGAGARAGVAPPTFEQKVAFLEQQVQMLTAQVAALQSVLKVTPTGAVLQAPSVSIFGLEAININSKKLVAIEAGTSMDMKSSVNTSIKAGATAVIETSGTLDLKGAAIKHNGGAKPLATVGSQVQIPGQPIGQITTGSLTVLGN